MSKHRQPPRPGNDYDRMTTQQKVSQVIATILLPVGIIAIIGILAGLAIAEVAM